MLASFSWIDWKDAMGLPNWTLSWEYFRESSRQLLIDPRVQPESVMRSVQRPEVRTDTPLFRPPMRYSSGSSMSSKVTRPVGEVLMPHFLIFSTDQPFCFLGKHMKVEMPWGPFS